MSPTGERRRSVNRGIELVLLVVLVGLMLLASTATHGLAGATPSLRWASSSSRERSRPTCSSRSGSPT